MSYKIIIVTPDDTEHPDFDVDDLGAALHGARKIMERGYYHGSAVSIVCGPGSIVRVMSDEELEIHAQRDTAFPIDPKAPWKLFIQSPNAQIPLDFPSEQAAAEAIETALGRGFFGFIQHTVKEHHDYVYVALTPGMVFLSMSTDEFMRRQRQALADAMREKQEKKPEEQGSGLIIPGREN